MDELIKASGAGLVFWFFGIAFGLMILVLILSAIANVFLSIWKWFIGKN